MQASGSNGATPGRAVLMQRQGNSVVAGYAAAPVSRPPKPSAPLPQVSPPVTSSSCVRVQLGMRMQVIRCMHTSGTPTLMNLAWACTHDTVPRILQTAHWLGSISPGLPWTRWTVVSSSTKLVGAASQVPEPRVRSGTPLRGLLSLDVPRAPSKWDKYNLLHDALKASADSAPVRFQKPLSRLAKNLPMCTCCSRLSCMDLMAQRVVIHA